MRYLMLLMAMLFSGVANAQAMPEPVAGDKAMLVLNSIFGKLFGGSSSDGFATINETYLGYVLIVAGLIATYTLVTGTLGTAHDGEMLGKKFSSVWIPIKYALGVCLILPVLNGYCSAQAITANLIKTGIGGADAVWSAYMSSSNLKNIAQVNIDSPNVHEMAYKVLASQLCVAAFNEAYSMGDTVLKTGSETYGTTTEDGVVNKIIKFGDKSGSSISEDACGRVEVRKVQFPSVPSVLNVANPINFSFEIDQSTQRMQTISTAHWTQTQTLINSLGSIAKTAASTVRYSGVKAIDIASVNTQVEKAISTYQDQVYQLGSDLISNTDAFKGLSESATKDGFMLAGAWNMKIYSFQEQVQKTIANIPVATGPTGITEGKYADDVAPIKELLDKLLANSQVAQMSWGVAQTQGGSQQSWMDALTQTIKNGMDIKIIAKKLFSSVADFIIQGEQNIVLQCERLGNWVLVAAGGGWAAGGALSMIPGIGGYVTMTVQMLLPMALMSGFFLSYVLPMIPFLMWMGAVFGWLVSCVEAIIVVPIWVVISFLNPHGQDFVGSASQGYRLLLQLLLRPVFMIFGLVAAITLIDVLGKVINQIFSQLFLISQTDTPFITWFLGSLVAFPIMYSATAVVLILKCTSLVHVVPDQIMTWLGGGGAQLGGHAEGFGGQGAASVASAGMVGNVLGNAIANQNGNNQKAIGNGLREGKVMEKPSFNKAEMANSPLAKFMSGKMSGNSVQGMEFQSKMDSMNSVLGSESQNFMQERLAQSIKDNPSFSDSEHMDEAFKEALNNEYGKGAGAVIKSAGKGGFSSQESQDLAQAYKEAKADFISASPYATDKETLGALSHATSQARENFENDPSSLKKTSGGKSLSDFTKESFKTNLGLDVNNEIDITPAEPKKESSEPVKDEKPQIDDDNK